MAAVDLFVDNSFWFQDSFWKFTDESWMVAALNLLIGCFLQLDSRKRHCLRMISNNFSMVDGRCASAQYLRKAHLVKSSFS
jgi:hypothetical protein